MRIAVCIPCNGHHLHYLDKCIDSIRKQTVLPDIISISISGNDKDVVVSYFEKITPIMSVRMFVTIIEQRCCAGTNRNQAVAAIADEVDWITFFDADDLMHSQRIEVIRRHIGSGLIDVFLHSHTKVEVVNGVIPEVVEEPVGNPLETDGFIESRDFCGRVTGKDSTNGHCSVSVEAWKNIKYPENYGLGEDSEYNWRLFVNGYRFGFVSDRLSFYLHY